MLAFLILMIFGKKINLKQDEVYEKKNNYQFTYTNYKTFGKNNKSKNIKTTPKNLILIKFIKNTSICTST